MSKSRFFEPYRGEKYNEGILGKKILIIGASFYCRPNPDSPCPYFNTCTSDYIKDSSPFDLKCKGYVLHEYPTDSIHENISVRSIKNFRRFLSKYTNKEVDPWKYVAFTNYVQYFLGHTITYPSNITERDFDSLQETIIEIEPDIIITWGTIVQDAIREWHKQFITDYNDMYAQNEGWLGHLKIDNYNKEIPILFFWHPSSSNWYSDIDVAHHYFEKALKN